MFELFPKSLQGKFPEDDLENRLKIWQILLLILNNDFSKT